MASAREEQVENHWPGYVDALTTMLMVLTFVMMILGIAVFAMSQNTSRILLEQIAKAARIELPTGADAPVAELAARILKELERPQATPPAQPQGAPVLDETAFATPAVQTGSHEAARIRSQQPAHTGAPAPASLGAGTADALIITFQPRATRLDTGALRDLDNAIRAAAALREAGGARLLARVDTTAGAVSDARRIAFYRAMLVRTRLMQAGLSAEAIRIRLVETPDDGVAPESVRIEPAAADAARAARPQP